MCVLFIVFYFFMKYYLLTAREAKRISDIKRAPLVGALAELGNGLILIRSFNK